VNLRRYLWIPGLIAIGVAGWMAFDRPEAPAGWLGYAEADYVRVAPVALGRVTSRAVNRGDAVAKGALLFMLDDTSEHAERDQAQAALTQEEQKLADLQLGGRDSEIAAAQADLADQQAAFNRADLDLRRGEALVARGDASQQSVDQARADQLSAKAHVAASQARLDLINSSSGRQHAIDAQQAAVVEAQHALADAQWKLDQRTISAPVGGVVADTYVEPGETVQAGAPVLELLPPENILVRFFVQETVLSKLRIGQSVAIACDSCPSDLSGRVSFVSTESEYTPPVIYSQGTRGALVYLVEARPEPKYAALLKPGQPVEVRTVGAERP
jgi:HlyD family secretion protein